MQRPVGELKETAAEVQMGEKCGSGDSRQENGKGDRPRLGLT